MKNLFAFSLVLISSVLAYIPAIGATHLDRLSLPEGFTISLVTDQTPNARQMALSDDGILFVGTRREGKVYRVNTNHQPATVEVIASKLKMPSGVALRGNDLYVGAVNEILKFPNASTAPFPKPVVITDRLPNKSHHGWKYLRFAPDGDLYVPVGAPCNLCESDDPRFASILKMNPETGETKPYVEGVRNSVGLANHPATGELWFTDNGRDLFGDDIPPEEVNRVQVPGGHYGYPYVHGNGIRDPKFGDKAPRRMLQFPEYTIQAHSAALGLAFYSGDKFGPDYNGALFIAEHGSWNRTNKVGYQISVIQLANEKPEVHPFVTGWLEKEENWGRPNDVLVTPNGDLLISDDGAGAIYRVRRQEKGHQPLDSFPSQPES